MDDSHGLPDGGLRFQAALQVAHPGAAEQLRVTVHVLPGLGHFGAARNDEIWRRCLAWLLRHKADDRG